MDESKFGTTKYGKGRRVEGVWVLGEVAKIFGRGKNSLMLPLVNVTCQPFLPSCHPGAAQAFVLNIEDKNKRQHG